jgi:membrane-associated protease RseP (regulator of RpoE activity)
LRLVLSFIILNFVVFVHELGHWTMARLCRIPIAVFSIGMGSSIWTIGTFFGTEFRISAIPIGGYVRYGQIGVVVEDERAYMLAFPVWKRALVTIGGPLFNVLLTGVIVVGFNMYYGASLVHAVEFTSAKLVEFMGLFVLTLAALAHIIHLPGVDASGMSGVVGIVRAGASFASQGISGDLLWVANLSFSLGMMNLLPIPVLDGGGLVLLALEAVRGKPLSKRTENWVVGIGLFPIAGLLLWGFTNDMIKMWNAGYEPMVALMVGAILGLIIRTIRSFCDIWTWENGALTIAITIAQSEETRMSRELKVLGRPLIRIWKAGDELATIELVIRQGGGTSSPDDQG